ncbi:MAG: 16S rRNA (cytidine(1402)-2'-O)-methyltransferase [Desulfamplus sp.]|nr:16S rRNA (cytidine(1402)-2'-O)-methyltransferase [Desulfamplus sp.]
MIKCEPETGVSPKVSGVLYIVATPLGNLEDITIRALRILREVDLIAAEDTRHTGKLLSHYNIRNNLISCHEHNESLRIGVIMEKLATGGSVALVSDAGTPTVSDPGYRLVAAAMAADIMVTAIPGPCAAVAALSGSGLSTDAFHFAGFLPRKPGPRRSKIDDLKNIRATLIFYESPHRLASLIQDLAHILGNERPAVVAREITKLHEEYIRGSLGSVLDRLMERGRVKGECVVMVGGYGDDHGKRHGDRHGDRHEDGREPSWDRIDECILEALASSSLAPSKLAKKISLDLSLSRKMIYERMVTLQKD